MATHYTENLRDPVKANMFKLHPISFFPGVIRAEV